MHHHETPVGMRHHRSNEVTLENAEKASAAHCMQMRVVNCLSTVMRIGVACMLSASA